MSGASFRSVPSESFLQLTRDSEANPSSFASFAAKRSAVGYLSAPKGNRLKCYNL